MTARLAPLLVALVLTLGCDDEKIGANPTARASATAAASASSPPPLPELLYLPDGGDAVLGGERAPSIVPRSGFCPGDMVNVASRFCIDRYEATLVDAKQGRAVSPYFPARRWDAAAAFEAFRSDPLQGVADAPALPIPPDWELKETFDVRATSRSLAVPNGYLSGVVAGEACRAAGKRLCTLEEWTIACRGEKNRPFPYGDDYEDGACNVSREAHPASVLHGNASIHHLDPRLNLVRGPLGPLLRRTGESPRCRSEWSGDAVFDMVGNLDEWVDDAEGTFVGGFYSRATKDGCEARIESHPLEYFDYSLGVRCCR